MYQPFAEACNHAFAALGKLNCDGLPEVSKGEDVVMVVTDSGSPSQDQDHQAQHYGYKPDICITLSSCIKNYISQGKDDVYKVSKEFKASSLHWRNILCPIEVKPKDEHQTARPAYESPFSPLRHIKLSSDLKRIHSSEYKSVPEVITRGRKKSAPVHSRSQPQIRSSTQNYIPILSGAKRKASQKGKAPSKKTKTEHSAPDTPNNNPALSQDGQGGADGIIKRDARIQLACYGAHRMSSAFDVTHTCRKFRTPVLTVPIYR
ncbi:hypothetical protein BJ165DRAFT_219527 [Panaeolus papilionaceus]|nr:hypothetical protein BJ165DRAFT_219527 [Panaeolus papilionaceus]